MAEVWQRSETFEALVSGLQGALWTLGAVPAVLRHDDLSAGTHEPRRGGGRQLTARFRRVLDHYGLLSSRIQAGKRHENGVAEQAHFRTATAMEQALLLRGERDFADEGGVSALPAVALVADPGGEAARERGGGAVALPDGDGHGQALLLRGERDFADGAAYLRFLGRVVDEERNAPAAARLAEERPYLRLLPPARAPESVSDGDRDRAAHVSAVVAAGSGPGVHDVQCRLRKGSTIGVGGRVYSVPSRLIGDRVEARQHPSAVEGVG